MREIIAGIAYALGYTVGAVLGAAQGACQGLRNAAVKIREQHRAGE